MKTIPAIGCLSTLFFLLPIWSWPQQVKAVPPPVYIGALESPANPADEKLVRVLFFKTGDTWDTLEDKIDNPSIYPATNDWTIAFDGRNLGKFTAQKVDPKWPESPWSFPRDVHQQPTTQKLPAIGQPDPAFQGFDGGPRTRPLVLVSEPNYLDPVQWKPFSPESVFKSIVLPVYLSYLEESFAVKNLPDGKFIFLKSYQSNQQDKLLHVATKEEESNHGYPANSVWFFVSRHGEILNLSKIIDYRHPDDDGKHSSCTLVDAGDYDGNGSVEIIFWVKRYNGDGYVMFYNDFSRHVAFEWHYH